MKHMEHCWVKPLKWNCLCFLLSKCKFIPKISDLQPLLGLGAPAPYISHLAAYQIQPLSLFLNSVAMKKEVGQNVLFMPLAL